MRTVSKRDLNQRTAAILNSVTDTEGIVVTERGKARWRVSTAQDEDSALVRLEREGRYTPPAADPAPWPHHPGGPAYSGAEADALRCELRGDN